MDIESELRAPNALVQLVHYHFPEPPESTMRVEGKIRVELCLTSRHRSARGCFSDQWSAHRFERIGEIFVVPPSLTLRAKSDESNSLTSVVCELDLEPLLELFDRNPPPLHEQHLLASLDVQHAKVRSLLLQLAEEVRHPGFASEMLIESIATQLQIELFRHGTTITGAQVHGGLAPWQLRVINERLKEVGASPALPELATLCRISVRQLTRGFRASRGCTLGTYVANSQMEHAKRLLATDQSVASIASTLGFSSSSNFCFAFRRTLGMTPRQFRQMLLR